MFLKFATQPRPAVWILCVCLGLAGSALILLMGEASAFSMLVLALEICAVGMLCRLAARSADDVRVRAGWNWISLGMVFFGLYFVSSLTTGERISNGEAGFTSFAFVFTLLAYGCCVTGLAFAVQIPRRMLARLFLDTGVMLAGTIVILALVLQRVTLQLSGADLSNPMMYRPLVDLALLSLTVVALASLPRTARLYPSLVYGTSAFTCLIVAHFGASAAALRGSTALPLWVYAFYVLGACCVALAAYRYITEGFVVRQLEPAALVAHNPVTHSFWFHLGNAIVPYTIAMIAATILFIHAVSDTVATFNARMALAGAVAFVVAGGLRHVLNHVENRDLYADMARLNLDLEGLVEQRTAELVRRNDELEAIQDVALVSAMTLDLSTILGAVAQRLAQGVGASYCAIYEDHPDGARLVARYDMDDLHSTSRLRPVESSLLRLSKLAYEPVGYRSSVIHRWEHPDGSEPAIALDERAAGAALLVPLVAGEQSIGVAEIFRPRMAPFSDDEISLAEAITTHAALATENARAYDKARFAANHDPVTGLLNHRALHEELARLFDRAVQRGSPLTVIMMDLNLFKEFNDRFGHQAGDGVLADIGQAIRQSVPTSAIVARYGGDEFTVAIPESPPDHAPMFISTIRERVSRIQDRYEFRVEGFGISAGVASYPEDGTYLPEIIAKADYEMYQDKWRLRGFTDRRRSTEPQFAADIMPLNVLDEPYL